ncbi:unnamed protein product, partial [Linum tenue]
PPSSALAHWRLLSSPSSPSPSIFPGIAATLCSLSPHRSAPFLLAVRSPTSSAERNPSFVRSLQIKTSSFLQKLLLSNPNLMAASSPPKLCCELISSAFQRCRVSAQLCRVSILLLAKSSLPDHSVLQISISDTGVGSSLEEFTGLSGSISSENWDGLLSVRTTSFSDKEIYNYKLNFRENNPDGMLAQLPSNLKNGVMFRHGIWDELFFGTEVCLSVSEGMDILVSEINSFLQKMLVLKIPYIATELVVEQEDAAGSRYEKVYPAIEENALTFPASTINHLQSGLEDYVLQHGNRLNQKCDSCLPSREQLKVGIASCSSDSHKTSGFTIETVIIVSETKTICTSDTCSPETEHAELSSRRKKTQPDRSLVRKAVTLAMNNLKERHPGLLLSKHALKIRSYAPDLARSIAGLITSSMDQGFREECFSLLGLQCGQIGSSTVEDCIKEKITSVIEVNDREPSKSKNAAATSLFGDAICLRDSNPERACMEDEDDLLENSTVQDYGYEVVDEDGDDYALME